MLRVLCLALLCCTAATSALAQNGAAATQPVPDPGVPVIYRGQEIGRLYRGVGGIGPAERARLTSERLDQLVRDVGFDPARVIVADRETYSELVYDDRVLGIITDEDARAAGESRPEYARQIRDRLAAVIASTQDEFSVGSIALGLGWAQLAPRFSPPYCGCSPASAAERRPGQAGGSSRSRPPRGPRFEERDWANSCTVW
jgi:hypothetical protein